MPWPHISKAIPVGDPPWRRLTGLHLLKRVLRWHGGHALSASDLLQGARDAVFHLVATLSCPAKHKQLETILHPDLHRALWKALETIPTSSSIHLDIESLRHLRLVAVNSVIGSASPGDRHIIYWLGQKIITSQKKMEDVVYGSGQVTAAVAREIGREAAMTKWKFEFTVSFTTKEKFAVLDEKDGRIAQGSNQFRDAFHVWKFGSLINWREDYPLQWTIYDINQYLVDQTSLR